MMGQARCLRWWPVFTVLLLSACSEPADVATCDRACQNVARVFSEQASDGDQALAESLWSKSKGKLGDCTASCQGQNQQYASCLAKAVNQKEIHQCVTLADD